MWVWLWADLGCKGLWAELGLGDLSWTGQCTGMQERWVPLWKKEREIVFGPNDGEEEGSYHHPKKHKIDFWENLFWQKGNWDS